jgi:hypothetical protein
VTADLAELLGLDGSLGLVGWRLEGAYSTPTEIQHRWSHPDKPQFVVNTSFDPKVTRYYLQVEGISLSFMNLWDGPYPFDEICVGLLKEIEARIVENPEGWRALDPRKPA